MPNTHPKYDNKTIDKAETYVKAPENITKLANELADDLAKKRPMPPHRNINVQRKGNDLRITCGYGAKDSVNIKFSCFEPGEYICEKSINELAVLKKVLEDFVLKEPDFNTEKVTIKIRGSADGLKIFGTLPYNGEFGTAINEVYNHYYTSDGKPQKKQIAIQYKQGLTNESLSFLRAYHAKSVLADVRGFENAKYEISTSEKEDTGGIYRQVFIEIYVKDAYKIQLEKMDPTYVDCVNDVREKGAQELKEEMAKLQKEDHYYPHRYAVVIGISNYKYAHPPRDGRSKLISLKYGENDAKDFKQLLEDATYSGGDWIIDSLIGPEATQANITHALDKVLDNAGKNDLVFIFYSGHGMQSPVTTKKETWILPYDYNPDANSPYIIYDNYLRKIKESTKCEHLIFFVDACKSGAIGITKGPNQYADFLLDNDLSLPSTKVIFTSAANGQASFEGKGMIKNGLFTYYLIKALEGEAPKSEEGNSLYVDLGEAFDYVEQHVKETVHNLYGERQTPARTGATGNENTDKFYLTIRK
jgi:hypothetical protein